MSVESPALLTRRPPERNSPFLSGLSMQKGVVATKTLTTGGGVQTMTVAEALAGLIAVDCQDAQTYNFPTAAALNAAIPGVEVGTMFELVVVNYGDTTITMAVNTGVTKTTIATVSAVLTIATLASKRFRLICTGVLANGDAADAWVVWGMGSTAAAVA